ncbi:5-oxopent-3-ene-1,2,5-tricarboxylate decarboxylase [Amycolatopsis mediterranei S699]|uniref:5-oxopent-3-ene-1,2,5-tricarboxylate decarboxylase n=2 Tax=Amycolatopsis mediterranei TaxID=33910 RepID=A0A0H3CZZ4_AMYMU|nr:fumarylacetoacetate hydrolase family protein [Amycolatopsis mediterranei]ADJ43509.1 5-oxopent-3-ene-1,2,5-tricarboxylate decarboxylase [Amycolatopsis mediterranei U32]AEK40215.1 5-oxopent-3-ene-1,2,5-tricarboxylate decarboxylase [Amycolatopsis mediterranei S699]AFO75222.1 5-oxopent-3-ene-1,2,5-tricarboxylate decarboxylase [Amycolatopsis mediterranei S699]AGT82351.1 5-oxopent-3-ene-1,2,5-tricarboxylate decarboxylase [Amycolatopsis mediterranei RB]KDO11585.1 2-hydroxyhepta-2,4-diene-1,7-dioat
MRLARIAHPGGVAFASIEGDGDDAQVLEIAEHPFGQPNFTGKRWPLADVRLLAPILPSKVIAVGRNYAKHAAEFGNDVPGEPMLFIKPSTTIIGPNAAIRRPSGIGRVDFEGELAIVIGQPVKNVPAARAASVILGYTVANDVSARDLQKSDGQWGRAKGFDTFCPIGPWIETSIDASDLSLRAEVDGELKQDGRTSDLVHRIPELVEFVSGVMTLLPGDLILTGTPEGVGPIEGGQSVSITIEGIGTLTNPVEDV